jgi:hypothetical protein
VLDTAHEQIREHADPKDQAAAVVGGYAIRWIGKAGKYLWKRVGRLFHDAGLFDDAVSVVTRQT